MAWKFLNIGKANAEINRLESVVSDITKERDDLKAAIEANGIEVAGEVTKQLTEANDQVTNLTGQVTAKDSEITNLKASLAEKDKELTAVKADLEKAKAEIANPSEQIVKIASVKAQEITAAQGQPPLTTAPATAPAGKASPTEGLKGLAKVQAAIKAQLNPAK